MISTGSQSSAFGLGVRQATAARTNARQGRLSLDSGVPLSRSVLPHGGRWDRHDSRACPVVGAFAFLSASPKAC